MENVEFYTFEGEVRYITSGGKSELLTEQSRDAVRYMMERIETSYPKAHQALDTEYPLPAQDLPLKQFRIVSRFCRCNFGRIDHIPDIDNFGRFRFEHVECPMRGECKRENAICHPEFDSRLSPAQERVMRLVVEGFSRVEIADLLYISPSTVDNHIRAAYASTGVHSAAEFRDYAHNNHIFKL